MPQEPFDIGMGIAKTVKIFFTSGKDNRPGVEKAHPNFPS